MPDTTAEVKRILARALRELEHVIDNPGVKSLLRELGGILGVEHDGVTATTKPVSRRRRAREAKAGGGPARVHGPRRARTARHHRPGEPSHAHARQAEGSRERTRARVRLCPAGAVAETSSSLWSWISPGSPLPRVRRRGAASSFTEWRAPCIAAATRPVSVCRSQLGVNPHLLADSVPGLEPAVLITTAPR